MFNRKSFREKIDLLKKRWKDVAALTLGVICMGFIQLVYWKMYTDQWFFYSYGEFGFDWFKPHLWHGILSFQKGWLVYTPVMILAIIGMSFLQRMHPTIFGAIFIFFLINLYVVFSWEVWWYGGGLGARPLVQSYALLSFCIAALVTLIWSKPWLKVLIMAFIVACIDINLVMHWQAHAPNGGWRGEGLTKLYSWKILGSTNLQKADRKYLDLRRELKHKDNMKRTTLYTNGFESDSSAGRSSQYVHSGEAAFRVSKEVPYSPQYAITFKELDPAPGSWIGVKIHFFFTQMILGEYQMSQCVAEYTRQQRTPNSRKVKMQRLTDPWNWHELTYEIRLPKESEYNPNDTLSVYVHSPEPGAEIFIDNMEVILI